METLQNDYFNSTIRNIPDLSSSVEDVTTRFSPPHLAVLTQACVLQVLDVESDNEVTDSVVKFNSNVRAVYLRSTVLWLALDSSQIVAYDLHSRSMLLMNIADAGFRIRAIQGRYDELVFVSESRECFGLSMRVSELYLMFEKGQKKDLDVSMVRIRCDVASLDTDECYVGSTSVKLVKETESILSAQCRLTGVKALINFTCKIGSFATFTDDDRLVLKVCDETSGLTSLVLTRLWDSSIETEVEQVEYCRPVGGVGDSFYFVLKSEQGLEIHRVRKQEPLHVAHDLASRGRYDEAHDYAIKNHLDVESVLKMKVSGLVESVLAGDRLECCAFEQVFQQITDLKFLLEKGIILCEISVSYRPLLTYLRSREANSNKETVKLNEILAKMDVMQFIECRGGCDYITRSDIFHLTFEELGLLFVSKGDLDLASVLWSKRVTFASPIQSEDAVNILNATPHNTKLNSLMVWLKTFLPSVLKESPFFVDILVKWVVERVFLLERSKYWPEIGVKLTEEILTVLDCSAWRCVVPVRPSSIDTLNTLILHMNKIKHLKETYRINMLIGELMSQSPNEIVKILLHRCYTEDLKCLIKDYLPKYMSQHELEHDTLLREYIEGLLATPPVDDIRILTVVRCLYSTEQRAQCTLHIIESVPVPWSEHILQMAEEAAIVDNDSTQLIKTQVKYAKLKIVLMKYNFPVTWSDYELVILKIVEASSVDLEDMRSVVDAAGHLKSYANLHYIKRCLRDFSVRSALDFYNKLESKDKRSVFKSVMIHFEYILYDDAENAGVERNYMDFLKGTHHPDNTLVMRLCKMYHLKNSYGLHTTANNFCKESTRLELFENWCEQNAPLITPNVYYLKSLNLSNLLMIDRKQAMLVVVYYMRDASYRDTLQALLQNTDDLSLDTVLDKLQLLNMFLDGNNTDLLSDYINMFTQFTANCKEEHLHSSLTTISVLLSIINSNYFVNNPCIAWKFHYIFMPISTYSSTNDLINFHLESDSVPQNCLNNVAVKNDLVPFRIISSIYNRYTKRNVPIGNDYSKVREKMAKRLCSKILLSVYSDDVLTTSLLSMLERPEEWLRNLYETQAPENSNSKSSLQHYLTRAEKIFQCRDILSRSLGGSHSYHMLKVKHNLDVTHYTTLDDNDETSNMNFVFYNIMRAKPHLDMECLKDMCKTFNIPLNDGLTLQILAMISVWELKYYISPDSFGNKQIDIRNDESALLASCSLLLDSIKNREYLVNALTELWKTGEVSLGDQTISVNPYHYEVFLCIFHLLSRAVPEWRATKEYLILHFLKQYQRTGTPKQYELDMFSAKGAFPEIGYYRLPFHLFTMEDKMWVNLKSEITLKSYTRWLPVVAILALDKDLQTAQDMLCSNALKQTMTVQKQSSECVENWSLYITNEELLKKAHECVQYISNMEWAAACLFYVLQGVRRGADQVAAAELCYNFAQHWSKIQPSCNAVTKMQSKYRVLSTIHTLHKMGYAQDKYLQLCADPSQLIRAIYMDSAYIYKMLEFDVNKAIDDIADKNCINISSVRHQILENILDQKSKNQTVGLSKDDLVRAKYILKATCPNMSAIYLVRIGLDNENDFNKKKKLRALQCLMSIVDQDTLRKIGNIERSTLRSTLDELYFSTELERIDMPFLVATFIEDKLRAVQQMWQSGERNGDLLCVAASICSHYTEVNAELARELVPSLLQGDMVEELSSLLPTLPYTSDPTYVRAWQRVLLAPFQKADHPVGEKQRANCMNAINLLAVCPVIDECDLESIWSNCVRCKCVEIGCLVLPYLKQERRATLTDWSKIERRNLVAGVKNLHADTFLTGAVLSIVECLTSRRY